MPLAICARMAKAGAFLVLLLTSTNNVAATSSTIVGMFLAQQMTAAASSSTPMRIQHKIPSFANENMLLLRGGGSRQRVKANVPSASTRSNQQSNGFFSKIASAIPPASERKKLIPLAIMFFCILFNYTILRDTKDVLLITAPKSGAEVIPFVKTYAILPTAISMAAIYAKLCNVMEHQYVFYACTIPFLVFFASFAFIIYPNIGSLHPHELVDNIASTLPAGFAAPLAIIRNWSYVCFYVMAEMWGSVVTSLLFWGFANEVTTVDEAKKYYPLFGMGANVALIVSGQYVKWISKKRASLAPDIDAWGMSLKYLVGSVLTSGGILLSTYAWMQRNVVCSSLSSGRVRAASGTKQKKPKMGLGESARYLMSSSYLRNVATLVVSFGMCINIVEVSWKSKLKQAFPNPNDYSAFMGNFSSVMGTVTLGMMLVGRAVLQKFGWRTAALVTPSIIGFTGLAFFGLNIFGETFAPLASALGTTPVMLAVLVGAVQNIMSKSSKYSLFDPCKEMAFIPLDRESKTKGKAAIDVIGNPMGKSGGAMIQQILIFTVGSLAAAAPYLSVILAAIVYCWIRAAHSLASQFEEAMTATKVIYEAVSALT